MSLEKQFEAVLFKYGYHYHSMLWSDSRSMLNGIEHAVYMRPGSSHQVWISTTGNFHPNKYKCGVVWTDAEGNNVIGHSYFLKKRTPKVLEQRLKKVHNV